MVLGRKITEREREEASNAYLISMIIAMGGFPFPILNLCGSWLFYFLTPTQSPFVKFHKFQSIVSQTFLMILNSVGLGWTVSILLGKLEFNEYYLAYLISIGIFNLTDLIASIVGAIEARKGNLYYFKFFGPLSESLYLLRNEPEE